jgi:uncharacterized protein (TIGR00251 family)
MLRVEIVSGGVRFSVHAQPRASRSEVAGLHGDALKVRLAAPPLEGAANDELVAFLAKRLGVPRSAVRLVRGARARRKVVVVMGVGEEDVRALASGQ